MYGSKLQVQVQRLKRRNYVKKDSYLPKFFAFQGLEIIDF